MNTRLTVLIIISVLAGLASCKNNDNVFPTANLSGRFKIINASPNTLNYFLNGTRMNNGSSLAPGSAAFYLPVSPGQQNFQFKNDGTPDVLFAWPEKIADSTNYSLYITGSTAAEAFRTVDLLRVDSGYVALRFVNAAPQGGNLDVAINDTLRFSASAYKFTSNFLRVSNGSKEVKVYQSGSSTLLKDTILTMDINRIYTLYSYGVPGGAGNKKFGVGFTLNY